MRPSRPRAMPSVGFRSTSNLAAAALARPLLTDAGRLRQGARQPSRACRRQRRMLAMMPVAKPVSASPAITPPANTSISVCAAAPRSRA